MKYVLSVQLHDAAKVFFENIRNTVVCGTLGVAGFVIEQHPELSMLGSSVATWVAVALFCVSGFLITANIILGLSVAVGSASGRSFMLKLCTGLAFSFYIFLTLSTFGAIAKQKIVLSSPGTIVAATTGGGICK